MTRIHELHARLNASPELKRELETALAEGGLPAAAEVAARHGLGTHEELSDLELELISAGKVSTGPGWGGGRVRVGFGVGMGPGWGWGGPGFWW